MDRRLMEKNGRSETEGWNWIHQSKKWHYYQNRSSLCNRWMIMAHPTDGYELGNDNSPDNCAICKKQLQKLKDATTLGIMLADVTDDIIHDYMNALGQAVEEGVVSIPDEINTPDEFIAWAKKQ